MTCQCVRSSAISVVIWFLVISSYTRSRNLSFWSASISLSHGCPHQRTKKRTKTCKKREFVFFPPPGGAIGTVVHQWSRRNTDFARATIIFIPRSRPYAARTKSQAKYTTFYHFAERISFAEHLKLVAESSEFHLTLSRAHRAHFFPTRNTAIKRDILSEKREIGMALKMCEFTPESGNFDTYAFHLLSSVISFSWPHIYLAFASVQTIPTASQCGNLPSGACVLLSGYLQFSHNLVSYFLLPTATCAFQLCATSSLSSFQLPNILLHTPWPVSWPSCTL